MDGERREGKQKQNTEEKEEWKSFWPAQPVEGGAVGFGNIIEEQLQLEGMRGGFPGNTETHIQ